MTNKFVFSAVSALLIMTPVLAQAATLNRQLQTGMSGTDVSALQTYLAKDVSLYPQGLVTGYFGFLTKSAVSNFQSRNGLPPVGRVGPATLPVLNAAIDGGATSDTGGAPIIMSINAAVSRNSATVSWNTNEIAQGVVYYSTSPLTTSENQNSVTVSGTSAMTDTSLKGSQSVVLPNLDANTRYYYMIYTTDASGNVSVTWPASFQTTN